MRAIDVLVLVWTLIAFGGLGVSLYGLREALRDREVLTEDDGDLLFLANAHIRHQRLLALSQIMFFIVGVGVYGWSISGVWVAGLLVVSAFILLVKSVLDILDWRRLRRIGR